jgi:energy-converting hydrogenase B subunit D
VTTALEIVVLTLVGVSGTCVVLARNPLRQCVLTSLYGLTLVVLFLVFQAPDVALSELVVGAVAYPLVILAAIARVRAPKDDE